jgi:hypothetical protein
LKEKASQKRRYSERRIAFLSFFPHAFFFSIAPHASLSLSLSPHNNSRCLQPSLAKADGRAEARPACPDDDSVVRVVDDRDAREGSGRGAMATLLGAGRGSIDAGRSERRAHSASPCRERRRDRAEGIS